MANVVIGKIEVALEDVLHWLAGVEKVVLETPKIITSVSVVLIAVGKVISDASTDFSNPTQLINIPIMASQLADIKSVWADIVNVFKTAKVTL